MTSSRILHAGRSAKIRGEKRKRRCRYRRQLIDAAGAAAAAAAAQDRGEVGSGWGCARGSEELGVSATAGTPAGEEMCTFKGEKWGEKCEEHSGIG